MWTGNGSCLGSTMQVYEELADSFSTEHIYEGSANSSSDYLTLIQHETIVHLQQNHLSTDQLKISSSTDQSPKVRMDPLYSLFQ